MNKMNLKLREFERESGLEIYGLGARRVPWEAALEKYAELIVRECQHRVEQYINECGEIASIPDTVIMKHFGVEE